MAKREDGLTMVEAPGLSINTFQCPCCSMMSSSVDPETLDPIQAPGECKRCHAPMVAGGRPKEVVEAEELALKR